MVLHVVSFNADRLPWTNTGVKMDIHGFNKTEFENPTLLETKNEAYEHRNNHNDITQVHFAPSYRIYEFSLGPGQPSRYLYTPASERVPLGDNKLCLHYVKMHDEETHPLFETPPYKSNLLEMCKKSKTQHGQEDNPETLIAKLIDNRRLLRKTLPVKIEEIMKRTPEQIQTIINEYLYDNMTKDELIVFSFKPHLINVNPELIEPAQTMPFNEHQLVFTNTKTGKSQLASKVGYCIAQARASNLMGFSTADISVRGAMDKETKAFCMDEILEEKKENLWGNMLDIMERGEAKIHKGKKTLICETFAPIKFMGNIRPVISEEYFEQINQLATFEETLDKITDNKQAIGSRMGCIVFDNNLQTIGGMPFELKYADALSKIVQTIFWLVRDVYTELVLNTKVRNWLMQKYDADYLKAIKDFDGKMGDLDPFLEGHKESYRHARGMAFKLACVENVNELLDVVAFDRSDWVECVECKQPQLKCKCDDDFAGWNNDAETTKKIRVEHLTKLVDLLLEDAEHYFDRVKHVNVKSFQKISSIVEAHSKEYLLRTAYKLPWYIRCLLSALRELNLTEPKVVNSEELNIRRSVWGKTHSKSRIWSDFVKNYSKVNSLLASYGIAFEKGDALHVIHVRNPAVLNELPESFGLSEGGVSYGEEEEKFSVVGSKENNGSEVVESSEFVD